MDFKLKLENYLNGDIINITCREDQYILDAIEEVGYEHPYSSRAGADSSTVCKLISGTINQDDQSFLSEDETLKGLIMIDVAYPTSDCHIITHYEDQYLKNGGHTTEPYVNPGTTVIPPVVPDTNTIEIHKQLIGLAVWIQCTWVRTFTEPIAEKGLCIRSYDRLISQNKAIGTLTGNYCVVDGKIWLESKLVNCNRRPTGWFREADIWHNLKGIEPNKLDFEFIPYRQITDPLNPGNPDQPKTEIKNGWIGWITAGITLLSFMR